MNKIFNIIGLGLLFLGLQGCGNSGSNSGEYVSAYEDSTFTPSVSDSIISSNEVQGVGEINFDDATHDFGKIKEGEVINHAFEFTNTGSAPVILSRVIASCGCTTPSYTSTPVLPGEKGEIKVQFDSNGQVGNQQKIITIQSNAKEPITTVQIKGTVEK